MNFKPTSLFAAMAGAALLSISPAATAATYDWNSGTFIPDVTAPSPLGALDVLNIGTLANKNFNTLVFTSGGTVNWLAGSGDLGFTGGASVVNNGLWDAQGDANLSFGSGTAASFVNNGTLRKSGGSGITATSGNIGLINSGVIDVQTGTFRIAGSGTNIFNAGTSFTGAGVTELKASATFNGAFSSSNLHINGGAGGISTGNAAVINGSVLFDSGSLKGTWTVGAGQQLVLAGGGLKVVDGATQVLTNNGTVNWQSGSSGLAFTGGASVVNNGLWDAQGDANLSFGSGTAASFVNTGTLRKSGGSGITATSGNIGLINSGVIDVQTGTFRIAGYGTNIFNAGTAFTGAGVTELKADASFNGAFSSSNLHISSGTHTGNAAVINGSVILDAGSLKGSWKVNSGQKLVLAGAGNKIVDGPTQVLTNDGTVKWQSDSSGLAFANGASVVNNGLWDAQGDANLAYSYGAPASFVNNGTLRKSGGSGTTGFIGNLSLTNNGTIDVQTGNITLPTSFVNAGTLMGDGRFTTASGLTNDGTVAPGSFGVGTLSMTGKFTQGAGGILALDLTSMASFDLLAITGAADLDGGLALNCLGACSFAVGDLFTVLTSSGARTGSFDGGLTLNGFATGAFDVLYLGNSVQLLVTQTVSAVPEPQTYALLLAGLLSIGAVVRRRQRVR